MDDNEEIYGRFQNLLAKNKGEIVTLWRSPSFGTKYIPKTETHTYDDYQLFIINEQGNARENKTALIAIQDYKIENNIPLDTPKIRVHSVFNQRNKPELQDVEELNNIHYIRKKPKGWEDSTFSHVGTSKKGEIIAAFEIAHKNSPFGLSEKHLKGLEKVSKTYILLLKSSKPDAGYTQEEHEKSIQEEEKTIGQRIEKWHDCRQAIQDYKIENNIPLDTPLIENNAPKNATAAANDEIYIIS